MSMKKTKWISGLENPVRKGLYERKKGSRVYFSYWTGKNWRPIIREFEIAVLHRCGRVFSAYQNLPWRGLANKP